MARTRRTTITRMAVNAKRKTATLLEIAKIGIVNAHVVTLQVSATKAFTAAETNIKPAHAKPTTTATSGTTALAMAGK